ncbi:MAG: DUF3987 domain-containing protein [Bacteroidaceae bacterium]|nr:DUF3987 domain-containing protein [Bacteroidaceae bacterium]
MSCHQIIVQDGRKVCRPVTSRQEYLKLRGSKENVSNRIMAGLGNGDAKRSLIQMNYSCLPNEDGSLRGATRMSTSVGMDVDHIQWGQMQAIKEHILQKKDELGLLMLEMSASSSEEHGEGGYHLAFRRRQELSQEGNLKWASDLLGVKYDSGAKDITRVFFTTSASEEDLIFLDDELFKIEEAEKVEDKHEETGQEASPQGDLEGAEEPTAQSLAAFDLCAQNAGLKPDEMDVWGEHNWHNNLMAVLSVGVAKLMSREQLVAVIRKRLPNYAKTEDCKNLIKYFFENYNADRGFMTASLRKINAQAQGTEKERLTEDWNPPALPKKLPHLIQLFIKSFPAEYHPVLAPSVSVVLAPHAAHFRTTYIDGRIVPPGLYAGIVAPSGSNKSFVMNLMDEMTKNTLQAWDANEWAKVRENQELREKMCNAKEKPARYRPRLRIAETMSKTSLLELQTNLGDNGMLLCSWSEADALANAARAQFSDISVLLRKAWDGDVVRQYYMSENSCNTQTRVNASILLTGTPKAVLSRLFSDTEDGMMQRFMPMLMPPMKRSFLPPRITPLSSEEKAERDGLLASLWQKDLSLGEDTLTLEMPKTQKVVREWYNELEEKYSDGLVSEAEANLSRRVGQFMMRAAIPFVALYGEEQKEMLDYVRWLGDYVFYNICYIFSSRVAHDMRESDKLLCNHIDRRVTAEPLLSCMPETFTIQMFREERLRHGQSDVVRPLLARYCKKGKLQRIENGVYRKVA